MCSTRERERRYESSDAALGPQLAAQVDDEVLGQLGRLQSQRGAGPVRLREGPLAVAHPHRLPVGARVLLGLRPPSHEVARVDRHGDRDAREPLGRIDVVEQPRGEGDGGGERAQDVLLDDGEQSEAATSSAIGLTKRRGDEERALLVDLDRGPALLAQNKRRALDVVTTPWSRANRPGSANIAR